MFQPLTLRQCSQMKVNSRNHKVIYRTLVWTDIGLLASDQSLHIVCWAGPGRKNIYSHYCQSNNPSHQVGISDGQLIKEDTPHPALDRKSMKYNDWSKLQDLFLSWNININVLWPTYDFFSPISSVKMTSVLEIKTVESNTLSWLTSCEAT